MSTNSALGLSRQGFKIGSSVFGNYGAQVGSVRQLVHDGDTLNVRLPGNIGMRFLGIDSPEVSFPLPGSPSFVALKNPKWANFFASGKWKKGTQLPQHLLEQLERRLQDRAEVAHNHAYHAEQAEKSLEAAMLADLEKSRRPPEEYRLFMAFAFEFLDSSGRLLAYLHPDVANFDDLAEGRQLAERSYNERQLEAGTALPYFIWPNIQPFLRINPFARENLYPEQFWRNIQGSNKLKKARKSVQAARKAHKGVFDAANPLLLEPFELRFIGRRRLPARLVIDLSKPGSRSLLPAEYYYLVPHPEDRLYVPADFVALFESAGWTVER
jgi:endonuclease YncB( thermonuclease family)